MRGEFILVFLFFTFRNRWVWMSPWSPWQTDCYQSSAWWSVIKVVIWNRRTRSSNCNIFLCSSNVSAAIAPHFFVLIFHEHAQLWLHTESYQLTQFEYIQNLKKNNFQENNPHLESFSCQKSKGKLFLN